MATFVLIHGAWAGGWEWREVERLLRERGHEVTRPTLAGVGERSHLSSAAVTLATHVEDVVRHFEFEGWHFDWRKGVGSPDGKSHRKAPQVVGDREDDLTVSPQNGVRCPDLALHSVPAQSPQTTNARRA